MKIKNGVAAAILKRYEIIIFVFAAVLSLILAVCVNFSGSDILAIIRAPFVSVGDFIRRTTLDGHAAAGWALYIFLGLIPLIFPIIKTCVKRALYAWSAVWLILSAYTFAMTFLFVNPHLLDSIVINGISEAAGKVYRQGVQTGMIATFFAILVVCVLAEFGLWLKRDNNKAFPFAKLLLIVLGVAVIFSACFIGTLGLKGKFSSLDDWKEFSEYATVNCGVNAFAFLFSYFADILSAAFATVLICKCLELLGCLKACAFAKDNVKPLNGVITFSKISVLVTLCSVAVNNILQLVLSKYLVNTSFSTYIPLFMLLAVCLVIIFATILKRAIIMNEEIELTI